MSEFFAMICVVGYFGAVILVVYTLFIHELVSMLIERTVCRRKQTCHNGKCLFLVHCSKYRCESRMSQLSRKVAE